MRITLTQLQVIISSLLFLATTFLTVQVILMAKENQQRKIDQAEISHIRYGLLNVDEWSEKIAVIMTEKIEEFELTPENRESLQGSLEDILYKLIDEVEVLMEDRISGSFSGVKRWIAGFAIDIDQLRDSVPEFAITVLEELNKPETKAELKNYLLVKMDEFKQGTFNKDKMELLASLLVKYGCVDRPDCQIVLADKIAAQNDAINWRVILILVLVFLIFLINLISKGPLNKFQVPILILSSLCLLLSGITTPMIELEARIDMLIFQLIGEEVIFRNNIIFFQSKSITDVVSILMKEGSLQMIFVGLLIFVFSIIFPSVKLISSYIYWLDFKGLRDHKLIKFFVIKSGKWSMADVMVVALFMAYIGFNGIIGSQLDQLSRSAKPVEIFSTNGTQLVGGFYLFLIFCISGLVLSEALTRRTP